MKTIAYIRCSTDDQVEYGHSLRTQQEKINAYALTYDLDVVDVVIDAGESGKTLKRSGFQRVLKALDDGTCDAVVVYKLDRLTRNVRDLGMLIEKYFSAKTTLYSVSEQINTTTANGRFVLNMMGSIAQWERETIAERTKDALQAKLKRGECAGNVAYGYRLAKDGVRLVKDKAEQQAIQTMVALRNQGKSFSEIVKDLSAEGILNRRGKPFNRSSVWRMVKQNTQPIEQMVAA
jgi:site-specific DNA recombinase